MVTHGPATEKTPDVEAQKRKGIKGRLNEKHTTKALYPHLYGKRRGKKKKKRKDLSVFTFHIITSCHRILSLYSA